MKTKEIHELLQEICSVLQRKVEQELQEEKLPPEIREYTKGQFFEATYLLQEVEKIIYKD